MRGNGRADRLASTALLARTIKMSNKNTLRELRDIVIKIYKLVLVDDSDTAGSLLQE